MEKIDYQNWNRRPVYEFFSGKGNTFYTVAFRQDVTGIYQYAKSNGLSFYLSMIWCVTKAINDVDAFHYVSQKDGIYRLEKRNPSFTDLRPGNKLFKIINVPMQDNIVAFCAEARKKMEEQQSFSDMKSENDGLLYLSCLPWIDLTAITTERPSGIGDDSIPSITWGKFEEYGGRKKLGISIEVNHRYIDGLHIGEFAENLSCISENLLQSDNDSSSITHDQ